MTDFRHKIDVPEILQDWDTSITPDGETINFYKRIVLRNQDDLEVVISFLWSSHGDPSKWSVLIYRGDFDYTMNSHQENYFDFLLKHPEFNEFNSMEVDPEQVEYTFIRMIGGVVGEGLRTYPLQR